MSLREKFSGPSPLMEPTKNIKTKKTVKVPPPSLEGDHAEKKDLIVEKLNQIENINELIKDEDKLNQFLEEAKDVITKEFFIIGIGTIKLGFETRNISEIIELQSITPIPLTKPFILGLINIRNDIISVLDFNMFLRNQYLTIDQNCKIVVLKWNNIKTGFLVNKIYGINLIKEKDIITQFENLDLNYKEYIFNVIKHDTEYIPVIHLEKLFNSEKLNQYEMDLGNKA